MRKIDLIVIHCSATRENRPFPVTSLIACHDSRFGFTGYHYYIERDGQLYQTRHENLPGAHALHYNQHSIGICYEGGLDAQGHPKDTRTTAQKAALHALLKSLRVDYPEAVILGHRELHERIEVGASGGNGLRGAEVVVYDRISPLYWGFRLNGIAESAPERPALGVKSEVSVGVLGLSEEGRALGGG